MAAASVKEALGHDQWSLFVSILSATGTIFGRFFVSLRQQGGYAFSEKSGLDKNVIDHSS